MKIKSVSIQAFKSYLLKSEGDFNFEVMSADGQAEPAGLISLYAPNGFGKTSFYDAVDYAVTKNVNRYLRVKEGKGNAKLGIESGSKYILRNREADKYEEDNNTLLPTELKVLTNYWFI